MAACTGKRFVFSDWIHDLGLIFLLPSFFVFLRETQWMAYCAEPDDCMRFFGDLLVTVQTQN